MISTNLLSEIRQDPERAGYSVAQCRVLAEHVRAHPEGVVMHTKRHDDDEHYSHSFHLHELEAEGASGNHPATVHHLRNFRNCVEDFVTWGDTL